MKCDDCGHELQIGDWPFCSKNGGPHESSVIRTSFNDLPIVIYQDKTGHTIFPGSATEIMPARYQKEGYQRIEMRPHEARAFASRQNKEERVKMEKHLSAMQAAYAHVHKEQRDELLQAMKHMSPLGRDLAMAAIERANREEPRQYITSDPGFHIECLE